MYGKTILGNCALLAALALASASVQARSCDEVKTEIATKINANGVASYTLEAVANDQVGDGKVVGSCEGGTKKIVYTRGNAAAPAPQDTPATAGSSANK